MAKVFLIQNDGSRTPVTVEQLKIFAATGRISRNTKIEFGGRIAEVGKIKELKNCFPHEEESASTIETTEPKASQTFGDSSKKVDVVPPLDAEEIYATKTDIPSDGSGIGGTDAPLAESGAYFYLIQEYGDRTPVTSSQLKDLAATGRLSRDSQVEVNGRIVKAGNIRELKHYFLSAENSATPKAIEVNPIILTEFAHSAALSRVQKVVEPLGHITTVVNIFWGLCGVIGGITVLASVLKSYSNPGGAEFFVGLLMAMVYEVFLAVPFYLARWLLSFARDATIARAEDAVRQEILLNELLHKRQ